MGYWFLYKYGNAGERRRIHRNASIERKVRGSAAMNVVYLSSEVVPFAKTGGLADIAEAIPKSLQKLGVEIIILMPLYSIIKEIKYPFNKNKYTV